MAIGRQAIFRALTDANAWLAEAHTDNTGSSPLPHVASLQILLGMWMCDGVFAAHGMSATTTVSAIVGDASALLDELDASEWEELWTSHAKLILLSGAILKKHGREHEILEQYAEAIANELNSRTKIESSLVGEAILLSGDGLLPGSKIPHSNWLEGRVCLEELHRLRKEEVRELCRTIGITTHFGRRSAELSGAELALLKEWIGVWTIETLRQYDFELGTELIRSAVWLGMGHGDAIQLGLKFLLVNQRVGGRFGYYRMSNAHTGDLNYRILELSTTVECIWTLCEYLNSRLFNIHRVL